MNVEAMAPPKKPLPKVRGRVPGPAFWILSTVLVGASGYIQWTDAFGDHAIANIVSMVSGFIIFCMFSVWYTFRSAYAYRARMAWPVLVTSAVALLALLVKIDGVDGEMMPKFRFRWSKPADELVGEFEAASVAAPATFVVDANSYAQFLGPNRNNVISDRTLERNWKRNPPEELWRIKIGAGWSPFSVAGELAVTLEQRGEEEAVTCYDLRSGDLRWAHSNKTRHSTVLGGVGPRSAPTLHDNRVFAVGGSGDLYCIDASNGQLLWTKNLLEHYGVTPQQDMARIAWGRSGSPLIVDDTVVVPAGGSIENPVSLIAFKQATGDVVWEGGQILPSYASPMLYELNGVRQIVSMNANAVSGHNPSTGETLWLFDWPGNSNADANCSQPHRVDENRIFISKGYSAGCVVVDVVEQAGDWTAKAAWSPNRQSLKTKFTNAALYDGHAYGLSDGILECVRLADGKRQWKRGRYGHGQILIVGDVILVQAESGELFMVEATPDRHRELAKLDALNGRTWNNLCLAGDLLLVRNAEEAACYRLPMQRPTANDENEESGNAAPDEESEGNMKEPQTSPMR